MGTAMVMMAAETGEETVSITVSDAWEDEEPTVVMDSQLLMSLREFSMTVESGGTYQFIVPYVPQPK